MNIAGTMCRPALAAAETRHGIQAGLLQAIGMVESGRRDLTTGIRQPWPWTINAEGAPYIFDTKEEAVAWVRQAQERGMRSIDVGCAQVNLKHHPDAFVSLEQAFDPAANADYAARFLKELHDTSAGGDWMTAAGYYHSQTPELANPYRQMVQAVMTGDAASMPPVPAIAHRFRAAVHGRQTHSTARRCAAYAVDPYGTRAGRLSYHADPDGCHDPVQPTRF